MCVCRKQGGVQWLVSCQDADNAERAPACWPSAGHSRAQCRPVTAFGRHSRAQCRPSDGLRPALPCPVTAFGRRTGFQSQCSVALSASWAGVNLDHLSLWRRNSLRKRLRFARNGGHHRNTRRIGGSCLSDRGSFAGLYSHLLFLVIVLFA